MNLSYKYLHFYIMSSLYSSLGAALKSDVDLFQTDVWIVFKTFSLLAECIFCVFCFTERSTNSSHARSCLQIPGKMILSEKSDKFKPVMDSDSHLVYTLSRKQTTAAASTIIQEKLDY